MSQFVMKCPVCARDNHEDVYVSVKSGLFRRKTARCPKGHEFNIQTDRSAMKVCPHCGNEVAYDQALGEKALCPVCKTQLNTLSANMQMIQVKCPQCGCLHTVARNTDSFVCSVCEAVVDAQKEADKQRMRERGMVSLIKYEGDNNTFVWKHPVEDFKFGSQLIVHDSQEALFFSGGEALDLFPGGTYTLTTESMPILSRVYKLPSGEGTFHSEVYFINKTVHTGIKWGTSNRIRMKDPVTNVFFSFGVNGQLNLQVSDAKRLLLRLVGTTDILKHGDSLNDTNAILRHIRSVVVTKVRNEFTSVIADNHWDLFQIENFQEALADGIKSRINPELAAYGFTVPDFSILSISTPEDITEPTEAEKREQEIWTQMKHSRGTATAGVMMEQARKEIAKAQQERELVEAETEARKRMIEAQGAAESAKYMGFAEAEILKAKGITEQERLGYGVQEKLAESIGQMGANGGGGGLGELAGLGVGLGLMGGIGNQMSGIMNGFGQTAGAPGAAGGKPTPIQPPTGWTCPDCGTTGNTGKFCSECGKPKPAPAIGWTCPNCGTADNKGKFCSECGAPKPAPAAEWTCPDCGTTGNTGKFCSECGKPRP